MFLLNLNDDNKPILLKEILLVPTIISDCKVNIASYQNADLVMKRMVMKCNQLGTKCSVDMKRNILKISV